MFLRYYVDLSVPFGAAEALLLDDPGSWVPGIAEGAEARGERLLAEVGFPVTGDRRVAKAVEITLGEPYRLPAKTMLPLTWKATGPEGLFPALEADLELAAMGPERTQLSLSGRYVPPLGLLGRALDRAMLHRVAEATVKDFVDQVGQTLLGLHRVASGTEPAP
ncbi:MAG: hypothetical protein ACE14W_12845 [Candidatus Velamenicoccus archaeovorus]